MLDQIVNTPNDTITLKEITDMLDTRHNNAMRLLPQMMADPMFGLCTQVEYTVDQGTLAQRQIQTYLLTKRQSIAVAARLNVGLLMVIVDYWIAREASQLNANQAVQTLMQQVAQLQNALAIETAKHKSTREALVNMQHFDDSAL
jgi:DNA polymerase III gamma/tau subunit